MRHFSTAVTLCLLSTGALAAPQVVTENITGVIGGAKTVDTKGYFGAAGADLSGATVTIYTQYVPKLLGPSQACRNHSCTYNTSVNMADTQGSLLVTMTVGSRRLVYSPSYEGALFFGTQSPNALTIDSDAFSGFGLGLPGLQMQVQFTKAPVFGQALSPGNAPVAGGTGNDYVDFYIANDQTPVEELDFGVTTSSK